MGNTEITKKRDYSIDFFKGITVIGIIFTHTIWWSGQTYVPNFFAQFSLFLDVPLFFFLSGAGATFAFNKSNPFGGIMRLIGLFTLFYGTYALVFQPDSVFQFVTKSLFLQFPSSPRAEVVAGSIWFIPVFVVIYFLSYLIISHIGNKTVLPLLCTLFLILLYNYESIDAFKGLDILNVTPDYIIANLFFFLFGYYYYKELRLGSKLRWFGIGLLIISVGSTIYHFRDIPFNLQIIKFPHQFYYVIVSLLSISLTMLLSPLVKREYFVNYFGKNALQFYLAQGIGSSLLYSILPYLHFSWPLKLLIAFLANMTMTFFITVVITFVFRYCTIGFTKSLTCIDNTDMSRLFRRLKSINCRRE